MFSTRRVKTLSEGTTANSWISAVRKWWNSIFFKTQKYTLKPFWSFSLSTALIKYKQNTFASQRCDCLPTKVKINSSRLHPHKSPNFLISRSGAQCAWEPQGENDLPWAVAGHQCIDSMCVQLLTNAGTLPACKLLEASQNCSLL